MLLDFAGVRVGISRKIDRLATIGWFPGDGFRTQLAWHGQRRNAAKYPDDEEALRASGATTVFSIYTEAGTGFVDHVRTGRQVQ